MHLFPIDQSGFTQAPTDGASHAVGDVIRATADLYARRGYQPPWIGYLAVEEGECVGTCGFAGPPTRGEVELAYFTFPGREGKGVATRMALELLRRTARDAGTAIAYVAHTLPEEGPSTAILRKLGFVLAGDIMHLDDGHVWKWRRAESTQSARRSRG